MEDNGMRILVLTTMLLASTLSPAFAQQGENSPASIPPMDQKAEPPAPPTDQKSEATPAQTDRNSQQMQNPRAGRGQSRADDREMGRDWRMHRDDDDNNARRTDRDVGPDWRMRGRETSRDRDADSRHFRERDDRDGDRADRNRNSRDDYFDDDEPRRRVKICVEYANGDEYCRYRR
jgi:hypothetical protein